VKSEKEGKQVKGLRNFALQNRLYLPFTIYYFLFTAKINS